MRKILLFILCLTLVGCFNKAPSQSSETRLVDITRSRGLQDIRIVEDGIYYAICKNLMYYDNESEQSIFLCSNAACEHNDDTCNSYAPSLILKVFTNLEKTKVFYIYTPDQTKLSKTMVMCDLNGENRQVVFESNSDQYLYYNFILSDDSIYFMLEEYDADKIYRKAIKLNYIENRAEEVFSTERNVLLTTAYDNKIIFLDILSADVWEGDKYVFDYELFSYNVDTGEEEVLTSYVAKRNGQEEFAFAKDEYLYEFKKTGEELATLYQTNLSTGEKRILVEEMPFYGFITQQYNLINFYDGKFSIHMQRSYHYKDDYRAESYIVDVETGEWLANTMNYYKFLISNEFSVYKYKHRFKDVEERCGYIPLSIVGETDENFLISTSVTSNAIATINGELVSFPAPDIISVIEIISKEDYYSNHVYYERFR